MNEPTPFEKAQADAAAAAAQLGMAEFGALVETSSNALPPGPPSGPPPNTVLPPLSPDDLPPGGPQDIVIPALNPEEVQAVREMVYETLKRKKSQFNLPVLPITDADRDRFAESIARRIPYTEAHSMMKGKLTVTFRTKTKHENDILFDQLDEDFKANLMRSEAAYITRLNNYNLMIQMVSMQGAPVTTIIPPQGAPIPKGWSLANVLKSHIVDTLPETNIFLLIAALSQFDTKVRTLSNEAIEGNFSTPAGDI